jgi:subtilisin family serine protease/flagellar hook assembly protein FlgD
MPATGPTRAAACTLLAALLALAVLPATGGPAAASEAQPGGATVRLVVGTVPGSAAAVTRAAEAVGATRTGHVRALHSVSFEVPSADTALLRARLSARADVTSVGVAHRRWFDDEPADPKFAEQRNYMAAMGLPAAWDRGATGSPDVRVAIVDSGVDVHHPDLAGKVVGTHNAVTGGTDVHDVVGHGTGTASVAAAATGNGVGIAGAGRNSSLLAVKVADVTGRIFTDDLAAGIVWAVDHGADVVNLSLGGPTTDRLEKAAVAYAEAHDVLVVAAAGNEGSSAKQFPAALPGVMAVGATSSNGAVRAPFSSFGSWVDLAAPGRSIVVATPGGGYEVADGTSYSAPLVSGAAALLAAYRPGRTAAELLQALVGGADTAQIGFAHGLVHVDRSLAFLPPGSAPAISAPADGAVVSGAITVSASSGAPRVRLGLGDLVQNVAVGGGVASASFPTYGLAGRQPVTAADCSVVDQCEGPTTIAVTVDNPAPALTAPVPGQEVRGDTLSATADAPAGAAVRFTVDGATTGPGVATDTTAPFAVTFDTEGLSDGLHTVRAHLCRDAVTCDLTRAGEAAVTVTRLHPGIVSVSPSSISPNGDGRRDSTKVTYRLDRSQTPTLQVRNQFGEVVYRKALGRQDAGQHVATWTGRRSDGHVLADGTVAVQVSTVDGDLQGLSSRAVVVDRTAPAVRGVHASSPRVLPVDDDYLDNVAVSGSTPAALGRLQLEIATRGGTVVRSIGAGSKPAGPVAIGWNGRRAGGQLVPGTYRVRFVAEDLAGNRSRSKARTITVSSQRLVLRQGSTTVTARGSMQQSFEDPCSQVFRRTTGKHRDWVSYAASSICTSGDAYAAADHQVRLPEAIRYGTVRVSAYGGRGDPRYRDSAKVVYYDSLQNLSDHTVRLGPSIGSHGGKAVKATPLLIRSRVLRWMTITTGVAWYDVRSYRVDFTYYVLR